MGAWSRNRTNNLCFTKTRLCQLSYPGIVYFHITNLEDEISNRMEPSKGFEPLLPEYKSGVLANYTKRAQLSLL